MNKCIITQEALRDHLEDGVAKAHLEDGVANALLDYLEDGVATLQDSLADLENGLANLQDAQARAGNAETYAREHLALTMLSLKLLVLLIRGDVCKGIDALNQVGKAVVDPLDLPIPYRVERPE